MLINGKWTDDDQLIEDGAFVRRDSVYSQDIDPDDVAAITSGPGRFHLIASSSCPWSHRTVLVQNLKGLHDVVPTHIAGGIRIEGYPVDHGRPWLVPGTDTSAETFIVHLHELYSLSDADFTGRTSVPVLWDSQDQKILSNESEKIIRALDNIRQSDDATDYTLVPDNLRDEIAALNARLQFGLSNAVYRAGLAERQEAYDDAEGLVFKTLDELETRLANQRYLFGPFVCETDWRLFPTLVRFDSVYHSHFRCTRARIVDYPNLWAYARDLFAWRGVSATVDFDGIRAGYYLNDGMNNPHGIVGAPPRADWLEPHGRDRAGPAQLVLRSGQRIEVDPTKLERLEG